MPRASLWLWRRKLRLCCHALQSLAGLQGQSHRLCPHDSWGATHIDADVNGTGMVQCGSPPSDVQSPQWRKKERKVQLAPMVLPHGLEYQVLVSKCVDTATFSSVPGTLRLEPTTGMMVQWEESSPCTAPRTDSSPQRGPGTSEQWPAPSQGRPTGLSLHLEMVNGARNSCFILAPQGLSGISELGREGVHLLRGHSPHDVHPAQSQQRTARVP